MNATLDRTEMGQKHRIPTEEISELLTAPVSDSTARQLLGIFKDLSSNTDDTGKTLTSEDTLKLYRRAAYVLDNLACLDGQKSIFSGGDINKYASWYHTGRKKLMARFNEAAEAIEANLPHFSTFPSKVPAEVTA